jgi:hypothetical protein
MDINQFNNLMNDLANLSNAIQAQTAAPAPPRELSFAKITDFFGDSQDPIGWLQDFESACQANNVADARKTTIVGAYLKGSAGTWLANKRMTTPNWPTQWNPATAGNQVDEAASFTHQFKLQFRTVEKIYEWQQQLNQRKQLPTESVEQYSSAIRELLRRIDPTNAYPAHLQVMLFLEGLKPEIKFFVSPSRPATLNDAIQTAQLYDSSYRQVSQLDNQTTITPSLFNIPMIPNQTVQNPLIKQLEELTTKVNQLSTRNNNNNNNNRNNNNRQNNRNNNSSNGIPCIYCGLTNHLSANCYVRTGRNNSNNYNNNRNNRNNYNKPVTCFNCGKLGHLSTNCLSRGNNNNNNNRYNNNQYNNNNNRNNNNNNNNNRPNNQRQNNFLGTEEHLNE